MREVHISIGKYVGVLEGQLLRWDESNCVARPAGEKHQKWWSQGKILSNTFLDVDMLQMNGTYRVLLLVADMLPISFLQRRTRLPSICLRTLLTASAIRIIVCPSSRRTQKDPYLLSLRRRACGRQTWREPSWATTSSRRLYFDFVRFDLERFRYVCGCKPWASSNFQGESRP